MARGWESKSIEAQQEAAEQKNVPGKPLLTRAEATLVREIANLRLSLKQVDEQLARTQSLRLRTMLEQAKNDLSEKIEVRVARSGHQTG